MSTGTTPALSPAPRPQRRVPRYKLTVPLDVTVLRSGVPENIPARTVELGEKGLGAVIAAQLLQGESVRVEFLLPHTNSPVRATAVVRYQRELCCGLEFVRLPAEQQSIIRYWTRSEGALSLAQKRFLIAPETASEDLVLSTALSPSSATATTSANWLTTRRVVAAVVVVVFVLAGLAWVRWQQQWAELESEIPTSDAVAPGPQLKVSADTMERRIIHKVTPEYPETARRARIQGTILLDAVVGADGTVKRLQYISGPEALSAAAVDAARWWRYEPYLVNGHPITIETTVAVNFVLAN